MCNREKNIFLCFSNFYACYSIKVQSRKDYKLKWHAMAFVQRFCRRREIREVIWCRISTTCEKLYLYILEWAISVESLNFDWKPCIYKDSFDEKVVKWTVVRDHIVLNTRMDNYDLKCLNNCSKKYRKSRLNMSPFRYFNDFLSYSTITSHKI